MKWILIAVMVALCCGCAARSDPGENQFMDCKSAITYRYEQDYPFCRVVNITTTDGQHFDIEMKCIIGWIYSDATCHPIDLI